MTIFACPVCQLPLSKESSRYVCPNHHAFDVAREGYVNLLLANQKRSQQPGDNAEMIRNRRLFLDTGYYDLLRDKLVEIVNQILSKKTNVVLDVGCGEGFYIGAVQSQSNPSQFQCYGIDISKAAIKLAARQHSGVTFAVAGVNHLPVGDQNADCILSIFAPRSFAEFSRVLKRDGCVIIVTPGPDHLWGLKRLLYTEPQPHESDISIPDGFKLAAEIQVRYVIQLQNREAIHQLLSMTPYGWQVGQSTLVTVLRLDHLNTSVDFSIRIYKERRL